MHCKCDNCGNKLIKWGKVKLSQRYRCVKCKTTLLAHYTKRAYIKSTNTKLLKLLKESVSIRGISRLLHISPTTVLERIRQLASNIKNPVIIQGREYEVDEMRTYIGAKKKLYWLVYALDRKSKQIVSYTIGKRNKNTINQVISTLILSGAKKIYTDGLNLYKYTVPQELHKVKQFGTNHIERNNLTIRTHLKRFSRRTICFSRSLTVLNSCVKLYFWA